MKKFLIIVLFYINPTISVLYFEYIAFTIRTRLTIFASLT